MTSYQTYHCDAHWVRTFQGGEERLVKSGHAYDDSEPNWYPDDHFYSILETIHDCILAAVILQNEIRPKSGNLRFEKWKSKGGWIE